MFEFFVFVVVLQVAGRPFPAREEIEEADLPVQLLHMWWRVVPRAASDGDAWEDAPPVSPLSPPLTLHCSGHVLYFLCFVWFLSLNIPCT